MLNWQKLDQQYMMNTYQRYPITVSKAQGNYLYDQGEVAYLDLVTGLAVNVLGHRHPHILQALYAQAELFLHISNSFYNSPAIILAEKLVKRSLGSGKVFFVNSGAEASETTIKLIHKWSQKHQPQKNGIVVVRNSFHGRTLGALRLTRQPGVYQDFPQLSFPVYEVEIENVAEITTLCEQHQPAAILVEPIQGSGGVVTLSKPYLHILQQLTQKHHMLFCIDEIQTGMGRTGSLFAYQAFQLKPDCILFAKGVGGGLPLGGVIAKNEIAECLSPGDHGTTFAPSPLSAALGNAVLEVLLDQGLLEKSNQVAHVLWKHLMRLQEDFPQIIKKVDGRGMMIGIHTKLTPQETQNIQQLLLQKRIIIDVTSKTVLRLLPPLTLTIDEIERFDQTIRQVLDRK